MTLHKTFFILANEEEGFVVRMIGKQAVVCFEDEKKDMPLLMYKRYTRASLALYSAFDKYRKYLGETERVSKYREDKMNRILKEKGSCSVGSINGELSVKEVNLTIEI